jgi:hypothetical protein
LKIGIPIRPKPDSRKASLAEKKSAASRSTSVTKPGGDGNDYQRHELLPVHDGNIRGIPQRNRLLRCGRGRLFSAIERREGSRRWSKFAIAATKIVWQFFAGLLRSRRRRQGR